MGDMWLPCWHPTSSSFFCLLPLSSLFFLPNTVSSNAAFLHAYSPLISLLPVFFPFLLPSHYWTLTALQRESLPIPTYKSFSKADKKKIITSQNRRHLHLVKMEKTIKKGISLKKYWSSCGSQPNLGEEDSLLFLNQWHSAKTSHH